MKLKKGAFQLQYLCDYKSNWFETSEHVYLVLNQHIALQSDGKKNVEILVHLTFKRELEDT